MQLIHNREIGIIEIDFDGLAVGDKELFVTVVMGALGQFEVLYAAEYLEEVFDDVFWLSRVLPWLGVDHEVLSVLSQKSAKFHSIIVDRLIIQEVHLF